MEPETSRDAPPLFRNVLAVASLASGLLGIPSIAADPAFGLLFGIIAIVLGVLGLRRARLETSGRGLAVTGIVLGILSVLAFALAAVLFAVDWPTVP